MKTIWIHLLKNHKTPAPPEIRRNIQTYVPDTSNIKKYNHNITIYYKYVYHLLIVFSSVVLLKVFISASESQYVTTVIYCACRKYIWNIVFQLWSANCYMLFNRLWFINTFCLLCLLNVTESLTECLHLRSKYFKVQFRNKDMVKVKTF